ncbi:helix-turn-helix domain-containing protein [Nocardia rhizosphaerihabitans]|uniref:helix-turn-helix domain-containing protein n=1 Tax=Nocardia rhizosphaerihabitans TaxID=1691570 RepID=UPI00166900A2|nr:helix-turn-helix domain-containing protein [Nocardia rhizosphaerihabitans]
MRSDSSRPQDDSPPTSRVVAVVELLAARGTALSAAEIAQSLALSRSTVGAILSTLDRHGWVRRHTDLTYQLGPGLARVGLLAPAAVTESEAIGAELEQLATRVGCGAALTALSGDDLVFVTVVGGHGLIPAGIENGTRIPLLPPAGATLIAHAPVATQNSWLDRGDPARRTEFREVLATIRTTGCCAWSLRPGALTALRVLADVVDLLSGRPAADELRGRVLSLLGDITGSAHTEADLNSSASLSLGYLSAPVLAADGRALFEVQIGPLRTEVTAEARRRYIDELLATARRVERIAADDQ